MSITVIINNNIQYIDKNHPEMVAIERYDYYGDVEEFKIYPFEMNVSNSNHSMIWNALGLEWDYSGSIHPVKLLKSLDSIHPDFMVRETRSEGNHHFIGVDLDRVNSYLTRLREIALEAAKREEEIYWC